MIRLLWECQLKPIIISLTWQATKMPLGTHPCCLRWIFLFLGTVLIWDVPSCFSFSKCKCSHCFRKPPSWSPWFILLGWFHYEASQLLPGLGPMQRTVLSPISLQTFLWIHGIHCYLFNQGHCSYSPGKELVIRMSNVRASFKGDLITHSSYWLNLNCIIDKAVFLY